MTWPTDYRVSNPGPDPDSESESLTGADDLANSQDPDSESETQAGADDSVNSPQESCSDIGAMDSGSRLRLNLNDPLSKHFIYSNLICMRSLVQSSIRPLGFCTL